MKARVLAADARRDPGSFRDPDGFVFCQGDGVYRAVSASGAERWRQFVTSGLAEELQSAGMLVPTRQVPGTSLGTAINLPANGIVLQHDVIPFLSYPYEWTFAMLRDAAQLHLDILERTLPRGWSLKDATPFNVQFRGSIPLFVDVLSFSPLKAGEPWAGYNQFCRTMLYPLMLEAYKHVPFQPWLRSELEGIDPEVFGRMFRGLERLRPGVLSHVSAQAYLQRKFSNADYSVRDRVTSAGITPEMIARNVRGLRKLVERLRPAEDRTTWSDYARSHYQPEALVMKEDFVREVVDGRTFKLVWDLGCNDGLFARLVAGSAATVVAMDSDAGSIDRLYRALQQEQRSNILPLLMNLANPSPSQGWASRERQSLVARGKPELTLALALVHHMTITANVPLPALLDWLAELTNELVVEFMSKEDPMVQKLLLNKDDTYSDYNRESFERYLQERFTIVRSAALPGSTRYLYHAASRHRSVDR